jgi:hypothetical protein
VTYPYRAAAPPVPAPGMVVRCRACARVQHQDCAGRAAGCRCAQCWGRQMASQARAAYRTPGTTAAALYRALGDMIALEAQRSIRGRKIRTAEPRLQGSCLACHQPVMGSVFGRKRKYCSPACKAVAYRRRRRAREAHLL